MKLIALAAALAFGGTAIAQDTPQQSTSPSTTTTATPQDTTTARPDSTMSTTDQSTGTTGTAGTTGAGTATADSAMEEPRGGYMPSTPALSGTPMPGQQVTVVPSRSATEAFPPPAPLKSYPLCKKGQYDNCRQRGGR